MLSPVSRTLTRISALCYFVLGTVLFLAPNIGLSRNEVPV